MKKIKTGILEIEFKNEVLLYCLEPTKSFTFGCGYKGMLLQKEPDSNWLRKSVDNHDIFVCLDDNNHLKYMKISRFSKKLS